MNGESDYFSMIVCSSSRREIFKTRKDATIKKALDPLLKRWGYRDVSKVTPQLRYYEFELKPQTQAGDTAGMEVFIKADDSVDVILRGFHPFINKASLKAFTQDYLNSNGWYLTRESSSGDGQLSLAVTFAKVLRHFKISFNLTDATYKIANMSFDTLHKLMDYYKYNSLKRTPDGDIFLLYPIPKPDEAQTPVVKNSINSSSVANSGRPLPPVPGLVPQPQPQSPPQLQPQPQVKPQSKVKPQPQPPQLQPQSQPQSPPQPQQPQLQPQPQVKPLPQPQSHSQPQLQPQPPNRKSEFKYKKSSTLPRKPSIGSPVDQTNRPLPPIPPPNGPSPQQIISNKPDLKKVLSNGLISGLVRKDSAPSAPEKGPPHCGDKPLNSVQKPNPNPNLNHRYSPTPPPPNGHVHENPPALPSRNEKQLSNPSIASLPTKLDLKQPNNLKARPQPVSPVKPLAVPTPAPVPTPNHTPTPGPTPNHAPAPVSNSNHAPGPASTRNHAPAIPTTAEDIPTPWVQIYSKSQGKYYYFNPTTNVTSWKYPQSTTPVEKPTRPGSSSSPPHDVSNYPPVRTRSRTLHSPHKKREISPELHPKMSFTAVNDDHQTKHVRKAPSPPRQTSPVNKPKQPPTMSKPKSTDSEYDFLPSRSPGPPTNNSSSFGASHKQVPNPKSITATRQNSPLTHNKRSEPINSTPRMVTPNYQSTGKPVKVGKHTIPAPPPNLPPSFSNESAPRNASNKGATLPQNAKNSLLSSIQDFQPGKLRPVTPDRSNSPIPESSGNSIMDILRVRVEKRNKVIQQSDESDFEDADDEW